MGELIGSELLMRELATQADMTLRRVDGRGKEKARLDDQNTLKGDHNKVTRTAPLLLSHVRVSHGRGLYPGWV